MATLDDIAVIALAIEEHLDKVPDLFGLDDDQHEIVLQHDLATAMNADYAVEQAQRLINEILVITRAEQERPMPVRPENKKRYPADWRAISSRIRHERAGGRCECHGECHGGHDGRCAALNGQPHPITGSRVVLTVAHLDHVPENCADDNLKAMCQRCHNNYDAGERRRGVQERQRAQAAVGDLFGPP